MKYRKHLLILDPTSFPGGSKVATATLLNTLNPDKIRVTVVSTDPLSWRNTKYKCLRLYQPKFLSEREHGLLYFARHIYIALALILAQLRVGKIDIALGASGPGVDLALYLLKRLFSFQLVQMIHGPVATSRTIGRCLRAADQVHYLESSKSSLLAALSFGQAINKRNLPINYHLLKNGLDPAAWPRTCQTNKPVIFWAASLLKWKGLETLLDAVRGMATENRPKTHICYIRPKDCSLPVSQAPIAIDGIRWHENPEHLDQLRSSANIFVSTSHQEPFGLSILEAMAAGHCVLIPNDGAYWDRTLSDDLNCIKYNTGDTRDLSFKLTALSHDMPRVIRLGRAASNTALGYSASSQFALQKSWLEDGKNPTAGSSSTSPNGQLKA